MTPKQIKDNIKEIEKDYQTKYILSEIRKLTEAIADAQVQIKWMQSPKGIENEKGGRERVDLNVKAATELIVICQDKVEFLKELVTKKK
jgi:hypothetical protein